MATGRQTLAVVFLLAVLIAGLAIWSPWSTTPQKSHGGEGLGRNGASPMQEETPPVLLGNAPPQAPAPPARPTAPSLEVDEGRGALEVFVVNSSGTPVPDAQVRVTSDVPPGHQIPEAKSGSDGSARFEDLAVGGYWVRVRKQGFSEATKPTDISMDRTARVNVTLARAVVVRGQVLRTRTNEPVAGAQVTALAGGSAAGRTVISVGTKLLAEATSDRDGRFVVEVPAKQIVTLRAIVRVQGVRGLSGAPGGDRRTGHRTRRRGE